MLNKSNVRTVPVTSVEVAFERNKDVFEDERGELQIGSIILSVGDGDEENGHKYWLDHVGKGRGRKGTEDEEKEKEENIDKGEG